MSDAGDLPIDIELPVLELQSAREDLPPFFTQAHLPRIRSINLELAAYGAPAIIADLVLGNFPTLKTLLVRCRKPEWYEYDEEEDDLDQIVTVKTLEIQLAPVLTRVVLYNCILPWAADIYSRITHLEIHASGHNVELDEAGTQRPTHSQLRRLITSLVAIEEFYLDIFPRYVNVAAIADPIQFSPECRQVTLHSVEAHGHRHCCRLAASFELPPQATFIIKQASIGNTGYILNHFAGPTRPPRALSLFTGYDMDDESIIGTVVVPFNSALWLEAPAELLAAIPPGHIKFQFEFIAFVNELELEAEDEERCNNNMFGALSCIDSSELSVLYIAGLKEDEDVGRLIEGVEGNEGWDEDLMNDGAMLAEADNLEILVTPLDEQGIFQDLVDMIDTGEPPFPQLHTLIQPQAVQPAHAD